MSCLKRRTLDLDEPPFDHDGDAHQQSTVPLVSSKKRRITDEFMSNRMSQLSLELRHHNSLENLSNNNTNDTYNGFTENCFDDDQVARARIRDSIPDDDDEVDDFNDDVIACDDVTDSDSSSKLLIFSKELQNKLRSITRNVASNTNASGTISANSENSALRLPPSVVQQIVPPPSNEKALILWKPPSLIGGSCASDEFFSGEKLEDCEDAEEDKIAKQQTERGENTSENFNLVSEMTDSSIIPSRLEGSQLYPVQFGLLDSSSGISKDSQSHQMMQHTHPNAHAIQREHEDHVQHAHYSQISQSRSDFLYSNQNNFYQQQQNQQQEYIQTLQPFLLQQQMQPIEQHQQQSQPSQTQQQQQIRDWQKVWPYNLRQ